MSLQSTALADAQSLYSKQLGSLAGLRTQAGNVAGVAGGLLNTGNGLLDQYNSNFAGLVNSIPGQAEMPLSDYVNAAANDVGGNFDRSRGIMGRDLARRGVNANSGRFVGLLANLSRQEAAQRAGAMTNARITGQQQNFSRGLQASQLGMNLASMGNSAQQAAGGLYGSAAGLQAQAANQYGNAANEAGQVAGQQSMADQLDAMLNPAAQPTTTTETTAATQAPYYLAAGAGGAPGTGDSSPTSWLSSIPALQQGLLSKWGTRGLFG